MNKGPGFHFSLFHSSYAGSHQTSLDFCIPHTNVYDVKSKFVLSFVENKVRSDLETQQCVTMV